MTYAMRQNYDLSKVYFSRVIEQLSAKEELSPSVHLLVLKKYSIVLRILQCYDELTAVLEQLFFMNFANLSYNSHAFLPTLKNLFIHYSKFDLSKGMALASTLMEEHQRNPIPLGFLKEIYLQLGVRKLMTTPISD